MTNVRYVGESCNGFRCLHPSSPSPFFEHVLECPTTASGTKSGSDLVSRRVPRGVLCVLHGHIWYFHVDSVGVQAVAEAHGVLPSGWRCHGRLVMCSGGGVDVLIWYCNAFWVWAWLSDLVSARILKTWT